MEDREIPRILQGLASRDPEDAWAEFLKVYSPLVLQVVKLFETDPDYVRDCFLFVYERLRQSRFRRLRGFRVEGPARFSTWLRVVVRRLCLDWHRREFGRHRIFRSIGRLSHLDQDVFARVYEQGLRGADLLLSLRPRHPGLTDEDLTASEERIHNALTTRQRFLLCVRRTRVEPVGARDADRLTADPEQLPNGQPDPEACAAWEEQRGALARAVATLAARDRLVIRLRFDEDLTLEQVARVMKLKDAQSADRAIRDVLRRLRQALG